MRRTFRYTSIDRAVLLLTAIAIIVFLILMSAMGFSETFPNTFLVISILCALGLFSIIKGLISSFRKITVDKEGIEVKGPFGREYFPWEEIEKVHIRTWNRGHSFDLSLSVGGGHKRLMVFDSHFEHPTHLLDIIKKRAKNAEFVYDF
ncbi:MAG: PH domain-containing protein [Candidatus Hydrothermarchaeales archaeon]